MASLFDLTKPHLAYYSVSPRPRRPSLVPSMGALLTPETQVPAAFLLAMVPGTYRAVAAGKHFDAAEPRRVLENVRKDESVDKKVGEPLLPLPRFSTPSPRGRAGALYEYQRAHPGLNSVARRRGGSTCLAVEPASHQCRRKMQCSHSTAPRPPPTVPNLPPPLSNMFLHLGP